MDNDEKQSIKRNKDALFNRVPKQSAFDKELNPYDVAVLNAICARINSKTDSWIMSKKEIAELAHMGTKDLHAVGNCIKKLKERGYLDYVSGSGEGVSNTYTIFFPKVVDPRAKKEKVSEALITNKTGLKLVKNRKNPPNKKNVPISDATYIIAHWITKAKEHDVEYSPTEKDDTAIQKLLTEYAPSDIKDIISFVWDEWEAPADKVQKNVNMDMSILIYGYAPTIFKAFSAFKKGTYKTSKKNRGCKSSETKDDRIIISDGIFI